MVIFTRASVVNVYGANGVKVLGRWLCMNQYATWTILNYVLTVWGNGGMYLPFISPNEIVKTLPPPRSQVNESTIL